MNNSPRKPKNYLPNGRHFVPICEICRNPLVSKCEPNNLWSFVQICGQKVSDREPKKTSILICVICGQTNERSEKIL